ncbi:MAG: hypothetical protein AAF411_07550 [Myxococcota bacterium]
MMRRTSDLLSCTLLLALVGCTGTAADEPADAIDDCALCFGKADAHGVERGSYLALAILEVVNTLDFAALDDEVPLNRLATEGIVDFRAANGPFTTIDQLDTARYVGASAFQALADYAEREGLIPFCGDGLLQARLEDCDDGNTDDGDACPATCRTEMDAYLIRGSDIGSDYADPGATYFPWRSLSDLRWLNFEALALAGRADGIAATSPSNGFLEIDELEVLSSEPFLSSLFEDERAQLGAIWDSMKIDLGGAVEVAGVPEPVALGVENISERPSALVAGPINVRESWGPRDAEYIANARLQQLPELNADGNPDTASMTDVEAGLDRYRGVFTGTELQALERIRREIQRRARSNGRAASIVPEPAPETDTELGGFGDADSLSRVSFHLIRELRISGAMNIRQQSQPDGAGGRTLVAYPHRGNARLRMRRVHRTELRFSQGSRLLLTQLTRSPRSGRRVEASGPIDLDAGVYLVEVWRQGRESMVRRAHSLMRLPQLETLRDETVSLDDRVLHALELEDGTPLYPNLDSSRDRDATSSRATYETNYVRTSGPNDDIMERMTSPFSAGHYRYDNGSERFLDLYVYPKGAVELSMAETPSNFFTLTDDYYTLRPDDGHMWARLKLQIRFGTNYEVRIVGTYPNSGRTSTLVRMSEYSNRNYDSITYLE